MTKLQILVEELQSVYFSFYIDYLTSYFVPFFGKVWNGDDFSVDPIKIKSPRQLKDCPAFFGDKFPQSIAKVWQKNKIQLVIFQQSDCLFNIFCLSHFQKSLSNYKVILKLLVYWQYSLFFSLNVGRTHMDANIST